MTVTEREKTVRDLDFPKLVTFERFPDHRASIRVLVHFKTFER